MLYCQPFLLHKCTVCILPSYISEKSSIKWRPYDNSYLEFPSAYFGVIKMIMWDILSQPIQYIVPRTLWTVQMMDTLSLIMCWVSMFPLSYWEFSKVFLNNLNVTLFYFSSSLIVCLESTLKQKSGRGTSLNFSPIKMLKDVSNMMCSKIFNMVQSRNYFSRF